MGMGCRHIEFYTYLDWNIYCILFFTSNFNVFWWIRKEKGLGCYDKAKIIGRKTDFISFEKLKQLNNLFIK